MSTSISAGLAGVTAASGALQRVSLQPIPDHYTINLWVLMGINALALGFATAAVFVRLKDPERRFLLKKTERAEGVYVVPHSPFIASIFISTWNCLFILSCVLAYMFWNHQRLVQACQTVTSMLSVPIWSWVWISAFAPIYACHMFPPDAVEEATSKRIAFWVRWRPRTVNSFCYGGPIAVGLPIIALSAARAALTDTARERDSPATLHDAGAVYSSLYALWTVIFLFTCALFVVYSIVLIRILKMQLSTLKKLDKATKMANAKEAELAAQLAREGLSQPTISFDTPTNAGLHEVTTNWQTGSAAETANGKDVKSPRRVSYLRRQSWMRVPWGSSSNGENSLQRELGKYSKLELLKLNTQIIVYEAVVFGVFCLAWTAFALARASMGPDVVRKTQFLARLFLIQGYIGSVFSLASAFLIFWRGLNVANTRMESSPSLGKPNNVFKEFAQKFQTPAALKPILEDDAPAIAPVQAQGRNKHIQVQIELMQHESKIDDSDNDTTQSKSPRDFSFNQSAVGNDGTPSPTSQAPPPVQPADQLEKRPTWQAPNEWDRVELASKPADTAAGPATRRGSFMTRK